MTTTISSLSDRIANLSPAKLEMLAQRLKAKNAGRESARQITRRNPSEAALPLSFAQQRLWFLDQLAPGNPTYNMPVVIRMEGDVNVAALCRSLNEIVRRHEILRTRFDTVARRAVQVIVPHLRIEIPTIDLTAIPETERETEARRLVSESVQQPFDLTRGPLLRATLLRLAPERHIALFTMHHIISDGWSMGVLIREVGTLYDAFSRNQDSPLPELEVQYADYALWQRNWLQGDVLEKQLSYWRKQLDGAPPVLRLPTDRVRPAVPSYRGGRQSVGLSKERSEELRRLSQRAGATPFMVLLAAYQVVLWHLSGEADVVVGTDVANRNRAETEGLIGFFVNQLVLRVKTGREEESFGELVGRVKETCLGAYANQDMPFEKIVEAVRPERSTQFTPLFQVKFILHNGQYNELELPGLKLSPMSPGSDALDFDLLLVLIEMPDGLQGYFHYNADLFEPSTISRMFHLYETVISNILERYGVRLSELKQILAEADRQRGASEEEALQQARLQKFKNVRRRSVG